MTDHRFDTLVRSLSGRVTRRQAVAGSLAVAGATAASLTQTLGQDIPVAPTSTPATPVAPLAPTDAPERTFFLFVQTFSAGTMTVHPGNPAMYRLTLAGHVAETVYFSDRPERIVGSVPTTGFLENLGFSPDNPPNAALVAGEHVVVLELLNPVYSETFGPDGSVTLTYDVVVLEDYAEDGLAHLAQQATGDLPETFDAASLFIDDCPDADPLYCYDTACNSVGDLGNVGFCWFANDEQWCNPCDGGWRAMNAACNQRFPACNNGCDTNDIACGSFFAPD